MHGVAAAGFQLPLGAEHLFGCGARFLLARLHLLAELAASPAADLKKAALLRALFGNAGQLHAGLLQLGACGGNARLQFAHALGVAALASSGALQLHGGFVGAVLRLLALAVQLIAALGERVLAGFLLRNLCRGRR